MTTSSSTSVTLLDKLCQSGEPDRAAWARFARLYTPLLYEWARRQGFGDAADLTRDCSPHSDEYLASRYSAGNWEKSDEFAHEVRPTAASNSNPEMPR